MAMVQMCVDFDVIRKHPQLRDCTPPFPFQTCFGQACFLDTDRGDFRASGIDLGGNLFQKAARWSVVL